MLILTSDATKPLPFPRRADEPHLFHPACPPVLHSPVQGDLCQHGPFHSEPLLSARETLPLFPTSTSWTASALAAVKHQGCGRQGKGWSVRDSQSFGTRGDNSMWRAPRHKATLCTIHPVFWHQYAHLGLSCVSMPSREPGMLCQGKQQHWSKKGMCWLSKP